MRRAGGGACGRRGGCCQTSGELLRWWLPLPWAPRPLQAPLPPLGPGPGWGRPGGAVMSQGQCPWQRWAGGVGPGQGLYPGQVLPEAGSSSGARCGCPGRAFAVYGASVPPSTNACALGEAAGSHISKAWGLPWVLVLLAGEGRGQSNEVGLAAPREVAGVGGTAGVLSGTVPGPARMPTPREPLGMGGGPPDPRALWLDRREGELSLSGASAGQHGRSGPPGMEPS